MCTKENGELVKQMDLVSSLILKAICIVASGKTISIMVKEKRPGSLAASLTAETSRMVRSRAKLSSASLTEANMKATFQMVSFKVMVATYLARLMTFTKVTSSKALFMVKAS